MECPNIRNLKLDHNDLAALKEIRRKQRAGEQLQYILPAGVLTTIFLGSNSAQSVYNIANTDFVLFTQAMHSVSSITKRAVHDTAALQVLTPGKSHLQRQFWTAVANGCEPSQ